MALCVTSHQNGCDANQRLTWESLSKGCHPVHDTAPPPCAGVTHALLYYLFVLIWVRRHHGQGRASVRTTVARGMPVIFYIILLWRALV